MIIIRYTRIDLGTLSRGRFEVEIEVFVVFNIGKLFCLPF